MQMVYKKAHKIGCARGGLYGEPWYVAHYDKAPTPGKPSTAMNINKPKQVTEWYETSTVVDNMHYDRIFCYYKREQPRFLL